MKILFAGGGTAGHVFPAIAVANAIRTLDPSVEPVFAGTPNRLEDRLVPEAGYPLYHVDALAMPRRLSPGLLKVPGGVWRSLRQCERIIASESIKAAVTFGGYVSFPVSWAAARQTLPLVIHEQNAVPGLANRMASRWADRVAVTFPGSADRFPRPNRVAVTGNPVREDILELAGNDDQAAARRHFDLAEDRTTVLIFGGSQGARSLNNAAVESYGLWQDADRVQILHAAGAKLHGEAAAAWDRARATGTGPRVRCLDFIDDMGKAYTAADIIVCRAGATSIAELTVLGKPAVLVPYPHATRDHQLHNARALAHVGGAAVIEDDDLSAERLVATVQPWITDEALRQQVSRSSRLFGRPDAATSVARLVLDLVSGGDAKAAKGPARPILRRQDDL
jgi:UDP-N-acetylglucosamine--N-acetylmuramyl-(pentapeptide) pyrophosphoryl-undecaprenol N-acetylglucosamine transferase